MCEEGKMLWGFFLYQLRTLSVYNLIKFSHLYWNHFSIWANAWLCDSFNIFIMKSYLAKSKKFCFYNLHFFIGIAAGCVFLSFFFKITFDILNRIFQCRWLWWWTIFGHNNNGGVEGECFDAWIRSNHTALYLHIQWTRNQ